MIEVVKRVGCRYEVLHRSTILLSIERHVDRVDRIDKNSLSDRVFHHHLKDVMIANVGDYGVG
jgi:hypothetical protein